MIASFYRVFCHAMYRKRYINGFEYDPLTLDNFKMTTKSLLPVVLLLGLFVFQADSFFFSTRPSRKRDCIIKPWSGWGLCQNTRKGFIQLRTRNTVSARYGGKPCPKDVFKERSCNRGDATASLLRAAIGSLTTVKSFGVRDLPLSGWTQRTSTSRNPNKTSSNTRGDTCNVLKDPSNGNILGAGKCRSSRSRTSRSIKESLTSSFSRVRRQEQAAKIELQRDVLLLIDRSGSIGDRNIQKMTDMAAGMINLFCDSISLDYTRIGVATFNHEYEPLVRFDKCLQEECKQDLINHVQQKLKLTSNGNSHLGEAIYTARTHTLFDVAWGARPICNVENNTYVKKMIFLISDGCSNGPLTIASQARFLQAACIDVFVVQVGSNEDCKRKMMDLDGGDFECFSLLFFPDWNSFHKAAKSFLSDSTCAFNTWSDLINQPC